MMLSKPEAVAVFTTPPFNEVRRRLDGPLQTTLANGDPVGAIGVVSTFPDGVGITALPTGDPVARPLMVQSPETVAVMLMSCVADCAKAVPVKASSQQRSAAPRGFHFIVASHPYCTFGWPKPIEDLQLMIAEENSTRTCTATDDQ